MLSSPAPTLAMNCSCVALSKKAASILNRLRITMHDTDEFLLQFLALRKYNLGRFENLLPVTELVAADDYCRGEEFLCGSKVGSFWF